MSEPEATPIRTGDRIVSIGGEDLLGATAARMHAAEGEARLRGGEATVVFERAGARQTTPLPTVRPRLFWWLGALFSLAMAAAGLLVLARAWSWHARRRFFAAAILTGIVATLGFVKLGGAWTAVDAVTRERAGAACRGFLPHPGLRIRGRSEPVDVFGLPLPEAPATDTAQRLSVVS